MATLASILQDVPVARTEGSLSVSVRNICFDSRQVGAGDLFVAIKGVASDGHQYVAQCFEKGAVAVAVMDWNEEWVGKGTVVQVADTGHALGAMACNYYGRPSEKLKLVGITGTNGKTTTATLLYRLFRGMGHSTLLISTIENRLNDEVMDTKFTTPDALTLNSLLAQAVDQGCEYAFMEVSSHALVQGRVAGIRFQGAMFSNITHDHLDYHGTFDAYIKAKKMLFDGLHKSAFALMNKDDRRWQVMLQNCAARHFSYSLHAMADFRGRVIANTFEGLQMEVDGKETWFRLIGDFNASNLLCIYATAVLLGKEADDVLRVLSGIRPARGRFEQIQLPEDKRGIVDYAHTPDALSNVLETIRQIRQPGERIITVVGCGGNRDATKRPKMASIAARLSDRLVLTSDNPRFEEPLDILKDMEKDLSIEERVRTNTIEDRRMAIQKAVTLANPGDIILVAGKGHETYQEIKGQRFHFDDLEELQKISETHKQ